ncbi:Protein BTR1 [Capsicum chinense]|nr:Protein BTR1 [Capsicum chinense]
MGFFPALFLHLGGNLIGAETRPESQNSLQNTEAGLIIEKGGLTISDFQSCSGARIQLSHNDEFFPSTMDRIVTVFGLIDDEVDPTITNEEGSSEGVAQVDKALEKLSNEDLGVSSDWPERNYFTSEAKYGPENMINDLVLLEAAQNLATVEIATSSEDIVVENVNPSFADKGIGTERPHTDTSYNETNMHILDHSI